MKRLGEIILIASITASIVAWTHATFATKEYVRETHQSIIRELYLIKELLKP